MLLQANVSSNNKILHRGQHAGDCGIPVLHWLYIFFALFGLRSASQLAKIYVIRHFYQRVMCFDILKMVLIDGFMVAWLIYGNHLYYSPLNNCASNPSTQFANEFMSCILFIGYLMIAMYLLVLFSLPCLYFYVRN
jgi:predicted transglutaminase-like protease